MRTSRTFRGFTLIETAVVLAILGIGVVSMLQFFTAGSMANFESSQLTSAVYLAENINEMMQGASYSTLHSTYDNVTYSPPKDGRGSDLSGFSGWSQVIDVSYVDPNRLTMTVPDTQVEHTCMVTVKIKRDNQSVYIAKWLVVSPS